MRWSVMLMVFILLASCGGSADTSPETERGSEALTRLDLPAPDRSGSVSLERTLDERRSVREYTEQPLSMELISQLLWAAQGVTAESGARTAPSAGGLYPLEIHLATGDGHYHYEPADHRLAVLGETDLRASLSDAALEQAAVAEAAAVFVISAVFSRTEAKYGERAERYVYLEAGHAAENLLLQAVALELGAVPIGAFHDANIQAILGIPEDHAPLYLIPVGFPAQP